MKVQAALAERDLRHAVTHLASAVGIAPFNEQVQLAFDSVAQQCDILQHLPEEDAYLGTHLLRAMALQRNGCIDEAVLHLARVCEACPDRGFELVLTAWLSAATLQGRNLGEDARTQVMRLLAEIGRGSIGLHRLLPGERALLAGYAELAEALLLHPGSLQIGVEAGILRRVGRYERALEALEPGVQRGQYNAIVQKGLTLRAMGDGRAAEIFQLAREQWPQDDSILFEQARSAFVAGDSERALAFLQSCPLEDPEAKALEALFRAVGQNGDRVEMMDRVRRDASGLDVAMPTDATANVFREHGAQFIPGRAQLKMYVSGWESPSNRLLTALYQSGSNDVAAAEYTMNAPPNVPDPASHRRGGTARVWEFREGIPHPALPAPSEDLRRAIAHVGSTTGGLTALWDEAATLGATLEGARALEIASALVHPPNDPEWLRTLPVGLYHYQVAGALVLANLRGGFRAVRDVFESLVFGPVDWVSAAAVTALGELARRDADSAREIRALLLDAVDDLLPHSCEPRFFPLQQQLCSLPGAPPQTVDKLEAWYRKHLAKHAAEVDATPPGKTSLAGKREDAASAHDSAPLGERVPRETPLPPTDIGAAKMVGWIFTAILLLAILFASL
ncbi:MAG: hypothetical protein WBV82_04595 [Myxococcaceae bacterium]